MSNAVDNPSSKSSETIIVTVNGEPQLLSLGTSVTDLIMRLGIRTPAIAVELNADILTRDQYGSTILSQGDQLEVVTLVGGG